METRESFGILLFFIVLAFAGGTLGVAAVNDFSNARASVNWPTVDGVILSEEANKVRYAYYVDGRNYEADRVGFLSAGPGPANKTYAAGDSVDVYIAPGDPALSVLRPGGSGAVFTLAIALSGVLLITGLGGAVRAMTLGHGHETPNPDPAY